MSIPVGRPAASRVGTATTTIGCAQLAADEPRADVRLAGRDDALEVDAVGDVHGRAAAAARDHVARAIDPADPAGEDRPATRRDPLEVGGHELRVRVASPTAPPRSRRASRRRRPDTSSPRRRPARPASSRSLTARCWSSRYCRQASAVDTAARIRTAMTAPPISRRRNIVGVRRMSRSTGPALSGAGFDVRLLRAKRPPAHALLRS